MIHVKRRRIAPDPTGQPRLWCECRHPHCAHDNECPEAADIWIVIHHLDHCNPPQAGALGTINAALCQGCWQLLDTRLRRLIAIAAHRRARIVCQTCGAPIATAADLLRELTPLPAAPHVAALATTSSGRGAGP